MNINKIQEIYQSKVDESEIILKIGYDDKSVRINTTNRIGRNFSFGDLYFDEIDLIIDLLEKAKMIINSNQNSEQKIAAEPVSVSSSKITEADGMISDIIEVNINDINLIPSHKHTPDNPLITIAKNNREIRFNSDARVLLALKPKDKVKFFALADDGKLYLSISISDGKQLSCDTITNQYKFTSTEYVNLLNKHFGGIKYFALGEFHEGSYELIPIKNDN